MSLLQGDGSGEFHDLCVQEEASLKFLICGSCQGRLSIKEKMFIKLSLSFCFSYSLPVVTAQYNVSPIALHFYCAFAFDVHGLD
jgi:hypothetical protein